MSEVQASAAPDEHMDAVSVPHRPPAQNGTVPEPAAPDEYVDALLSPRHPPAQSGPALKPAALAEANGTAPAKPAGPAPRSASVQPTPPAAPSTKAPKRGAGRRSTPVKVEFDIVSDETGPLGYTCIACQSSFRDRQLNGSRMAAHLYACKKTSLEVKMHAWESSAPLKKTKSDPRLQPPRSHVFESAEAGVSVMSVPCLAALHHVPESQTYLTLPNDAVAGRISQNSSLHYEHDVPSAVSEENLVQTRDPGRLPVSTTARMMDEGTSLDSVACAIAVATASSATVAAAAAERARVTALFATAATDTATEAAYAAASASAAATVAAAAAIRATAAAVAAGTDIGRIPSLASGIALPSVPAPTTAGAPANAQPTFVASPASPIADRQVSASALTTTMIAGAEQAQQAMTATVSPSNGTLMLSPLAESPLAPQLSLRLEPESESTLSLALKSAAGDALPPEQSPGTMPCSKSAPPSYCSLSANPASAPILRAVVPSDVAKAAAAGAAAAEEALAAAAAAAAMTEATEAGSLRAQPATAFSSTGKRKRIGGRPATPLKSEVTVVVDLSGNRLGYTCNACNSTLRDRQVNGSRIAAHLFACKATTDAVKIAAWECSEPLRKSKPDPRAPVTTPAPAVLREAVTSEKQDTVTALTCSAAMVSELKVASKDEEMTQPQQSFDPGQAVQLSLAAAGVAHADHAEANFAGINTELTQGLFLMSTRAMPLEVASLESELCEPSARISTPAPGCSGPSQSPTSPKAAVGNKRKRLGGRSATPLKSEVTIVLNDSGGPTGYTCNACSTRLRDRQLNGSRIAAHLYACKDTSVEVKTRAWLSSAPLKKLKPDPRPHSVSLESHGEQSSADSKVMNPLPEHDAAGAASIVGIVGDAVSAV
jgi:trimeric autotransporter adhesin